MPISLEIEQQLRAAQNTVQAVIDQHTYRDERWRLTDTNSVFSYLIFLAAVGLCIRGIMQGLEGEKPTTTLTFSLLAAIVSCGIQVFGRRIRECGDERDRLEIRPEFAAAMADVVGNLPELSQIDFPAYEKARRNLLNACSTKSWLTPFSQCQSKPRHIYYRAQMLLVDIDELLLVDEIVLRLGEQGL